jgi:hypothetical protein
MIWIFGASSHGKVILEIFNKNFLVVGGFIDENESLSEFMGYPVTLPTDLIDTDASVILGVGSNDARRRLADNYSYNYCIAIHPTAVLSDTINIAEGSVLMALSVYNRVVA